MISCEIDRSAGLIIIILHFAQPWDSPCPICNGKHGNYGLHGEWYRNGTEYCLICNSSSNKFKLAIVEQTVHVSNLKKCSVQNIFGKFFHANLQYIYFFSSKVPAEITYYQTPWQSLVLNFLKECALIELRDVKSQTHYKSEILVSDSCYLPCTNKAKIKQKLNKYKSYCYIKSSIKNVVKSLKITANKN